MLGHLEQVVHFITPLSESSTSHGNSSSQLVWNVLFRFDESYSLLSKGFRFALCALILLPDFIDLESLVTNLSIFGPKKVGGEHVLRSTVAWPLEFYREELGTEVDTRRVMGRFKPKVSHN